MLPRASLGLIGLAMLAGTLSADDNWSRFRGPNGLGVSDAKSIPVAWTDKDFLWQVKLPGLGNGSPIVWGDKIFLQSASPEGAKRMMVCLSAADGKVLWTADVAGAKVKTHDKNTLASSTPCTDGERVYGLFWDGAKISIHAFDMAGKPVWNRDLGGHASQHGAGASPIVFEGKVILNNDQDGKAELIALDAKTGEVKWQKERKAFRASYSTPLLRDKTDEGSELIVASTAGVTGYNPQSGQENWHWTWNFLAMPLRNVGSPLLHQGTVFAISGDGKGDRSMVAVKAGGNGQLSKDAMLWRKDKDTPYVPCWLGLGDYIYGVNDKGFAMCFEAKTGKEMWNERVCGAVTASPVMIDGQVYAIDETGEAAVFPATPAFKAPTLSKVGEAVMATPAVAGGKLFIRGRTTLYCLGKK